MLRARAAVGVALAVFAIGGAVLVGGSTSGAAPGESCGYSESSYTTDSLTDVRSFSDAMAIVRAVKETVPPPPGGPEGYAGLIGRKVTVLVERVLWRRPNAPEPPRRFRFNDLGWGGTLENKRPLVVCGQTRMKTGRRYLAPIVRGERVWYPFFPTRLRLRDGRVVGGVDGGEPENSHRALQGMSVKGAARAVARAVPYRAVVLNPDGSPGQRWQRVHRDHYRLWHARPGMPVTVASGVTDKARWQLYLRLPARGDMCVGMSLRGLWRDHPDGGAESCGPREARRRDLRVSTFTATRRGLFAFGRTGTAVVTVRATFPGEQAKEVPTLPAPRPLRGGNRFWVAPAEGACEAVTVQGLDRNDNVIAEERIEPGPPPPPGAPDPYAACRSG